MTNLETALNYATRGFAVFPCRSMGKEPATGRGGFHHATTNPATIRRWWLANPDYNIGIATGLTSTVFVLDVDGGFGAAALQDLELEHGPLPRTACSITSAGCHLWFQIRDNVPSSAGRLGVGLDVRADGGYVLAPPSIHPDGPTYRWISNEAPAPAPTWLVKLAQKTPPPPPTTRQPVRRYPGGASAYAMAALEAEITELAHAPQGTRNHALNRAAFSLYQLVAGGELDGAEVHAHLIYAATINGLMTDPTDGPRSVERTIASGAQAGMRNPRSRGVL